MVTAPKFYVYCLFRPWNGVPCYIGKGTGKRIQRHWSNTAADRHNNQHLANTIRKAGGELPYAILWQGDDEAEAFLWEVRFIEVLGRDANGGPLTNRTDGGEGPTGLQFTEDAKRAIGRRSKEQWGRQDYRDIQTVRRAEVAARPEVKAAKSATFLRLWSDPAYRAKMDVARRGVWTEERRAARSEQAKAFWSNETVRSASSEASKKMWATKTSTEMEAISLKRSALAKQQWARLSEQEKEARKQRILASQNVAREKQRAGVKDAWANLTPAQRTDRSARLAAGQQRRRERERSQAIE